MYGTGEGVEKKAHTLSEWENKLLEYICIYQKFKW